MRLKTLQYVALAFLTLTPAVLMVLMWGGDIPNEPFAFIMLCAMTVGLWCPLAFYVSELVHNVNGWTYEGGTYSKYVWLDGTYDNECVRVFVETKNHGGSSPYWVSVFVDDSDYFGDECITMVHSYGDFGSLVGVLAHAEDVAYDLLLKGAAEPF